MGRCYAEGKTGAEWAFGLEGSITEHDLLASYLLNFLLISYEVLFCDYHVVLLPYRHGRRARL